MSGDNVQRAGSDTYVDQAAPTRNHRAAVNLLIGGTSSNTAFGYIYFPLVPPRGATIVSATLQMFSQGVWGANQTLHVQRLAGQVKFSQVNWNNRPTVTGGTVSTTVDITAAFTPVNFDVTNQVQTWANGAGVFGWRISGDNTTRHNLVSMNAGSHKPTLHVVWSDAPQAPTGLVPSGGQAVSLSNPVLQFDYFDLGGASDPAAVQVQIDDDASWSTGVNWDSGPVPAQDPELDLSQPVPAPVVGPAVYPGLGPDMVRYWRVRAQDSAGNWSRWSHRADGSGAKMVRRTKGTLTLLSPTGGVVDDFTPVVAWHFAGREMAHWRIIIRDPADNSIVYWDSGQRTGTLDNQDQYATTLPRGALTRWGRTYQLALRVWDFQDRVTTPGDPPYVYVTHDFTLTETPGVAAPTNLAGTSDLDGKPYMTLSFRRANTPDEWRILRDGVLVLDVPGADLLTNTVGLYRWTDRDATPNVSHTWTVRAGETNADPAHPGTQLSPAASWTGRIATYHAWLVDWDSDRLVAILDPDITFEMPDTSATYEPIARNRVVRVSTVQRGMQGSVSGRLIDAANTSLATYEDNFLWMKARPTRAYRLMTGNRSWRVNIGDAVLSPMRIPDSVASLISFSFWSLDGPDTT